MGTCWSIYLPVTAWRVTFSYYSDTLFYNVLHWIFLSSYQVTATFEILKLTIIWGINLDQSVRIHNNESDCRGSTMNDKLISNYLDDHILYCKRNWINQEKEGETKTHEDISSAG